MDKQIKRQIAICSCIAFVTLTIFLIVLVNVLNISSENRTNSITEVENDDISNEQESLSGSSLSITNEESASIDEIPQERVKIEETSETSTSSKMKKEDIKSSSKLEADKGDTLENNEEIHTHAYGEWQISTKATCTENGVSRRYCSCGEYEEKVIPATGHLYGEWYVYYNATINSEGEKRRDCKNCYKYESETIPQLKSYTIDIQFVDAFSNAIVPNEQVHYSVYSDNFIGKKYAENSTYTAEVTGFTEDYYAIPEKQSGIVTENLIITFYLTPKYTYSLTTASVGTVRNGGIYYLLNGKYYQITTQISNVTSSSPWKQIVTYYAGDTYIGEQVVPWMSYEDICNISTLYSKSSN